MRSFLVCAALLLPSDLVLAQKPVFDAHVHLWKGQESLDAYEKQLEASGLEAAGFAGDCVVVWTTEQRVSRCRPIWF